VRTGTVGLALQPALHRLGIPYEVRGRRRSVAEHSRQAGVGSLYYLRDGESVAAMSRMGSNKRPDISRHWVKSKNPASAAVSGRPARIGHDRTVQDVRQYRLGLRSP
jgi:hypothetical protein